MMKEIFQRRAFWAILVILLLAVFIYPPFIQIIRPEGVIAERSWGWIFSSPKSHIRFLMELDFKMIIAESIIAILVSIGVCLIPFGKGGKKKD